MGLFDFFKPKKENTKSTYAETKRPVLRPGTTTKGKVSMMFQDLQYGLGLTEEKPFMYDQRTKATQERMRKETLAQAQRNNDDRPKKPAAPQKTQAEIKKETEIAEGQARRKKFEQEAAQRRQKFKARTGQRLLFSSLSLNS